MTRDRALTDPRAVVRLIPAMWMLCWVAILIAGLWPFSTHRTNQVTWLGDQRGGLQFGANGIAISSRTLARYIGSENANLPFTIELLLRGEAQKDSRLAGVFVEDGSAKDPDLAVEQYSDLLLLRGYFDDGSQRTYKKLGVKGALKSDKTTHVAITSGDSGTKLYVDGIVAEQFRYRLPAKNFTRPFLLGNSGFLGTPWSGEMLALATFRGERSPAQVAEDARDWLAGKANDGGATSFFGFREPGGETASSSVPGAPPIKVPKYLHVLHRRLLVWDLKESTSGLEDVAINILGFVPFGFLGVELFQRRLSLLKAVVFLVVCGFAVSLLIEITQSYIPLRSSSSTDLFFNTSGTAIGALLYVFLTWLGISTRPLPIDNNRP